MWYIHEKTLNILYILVLIFFVALFLKAPTAIDDNMLASIMEEESQNLRRDLEHYAEIMRNAKV